jgi:hypothetical protein
MKFLEDGRVYALLIIAAGVVLTVFHFDRAGDSLMLLGAGIFQHPYRKDAQ